jgi:hypothetical protein
VRVKDKIIPIDSKFSLENYNRLAGEKNDAEKIRLEKVFVNDLKLRIQETSKYIRPSEGTMDFAFMFIPSEGIYYDLLINQVGNIKTNTRDLIEYAFQQKKVIIVSPTSFMAYLQTVLQGLRSLQIEEQAKEMSFLLMALIVALVGVVLVLIGQFNSISTPVVLMLSILFSFIGVFLGLVIFRQEFVIVMTMLGIISLAGVVVNNAIVLIDFTIMLIDRRKEELGIPVESQLPWAELKRITIESGATRLRPVMLTAITTILGLVPLVFGLNIDFVNWFSTYDANFYLGGDNVAFWKPRSVAIIYGVVFSFFLTLIMVPVMFVMLQKMKYKYVFKLPVDGE